MSSTGPRLEVEPDTAVHIDRSTCTEPDADHAGVAALDGQPAGPAAWLFRVAGRQVRVTRDNGRAVGYPNVITLPPNSRARSR